MRPVTEGSRDASQGGDAALPEEPARPGDARPGDISLPATDPFLAQGDHDLDALAEHWRAAARLAPMSAEAMRGADRRAQALGVPGRLLMEHAGAAVAAAARALLHEAERTELGPVLVLAGPGNNGGDGHVAARFLAGWGVRSVVALVASDAPGTRDAAANWDRLDGLAGVDRLGAPTSRDVRRLGQDVEDASLVIDALLGTGVRGSLREPIRSAVELALRARREGVPVLAVDTPTAVDLSSGEPSDPVVHAHVTVTFHRPKLGLLTRAGSGLAGRVLVAPIGIPPAADRP
jgi:hydroxyethylthiazole kinase-like uncharacterized protein yjeF